MTGFFDWSFSEYTKFIKAFKKREIGDIDGIANDIESKSPE